jgi:hypothetical protein
MGKAYLETELAQFTEDLKAEVERHPEAPPGTCWWVTTCDDGITKYWILDEIGRETWTNYLNEKSSLTEAEFNAIVNRYPDGGG